MVSADDAPEVDIQVVWSAIDALELHVRISLRLAADLKVDLG